MMIPSRSLSTRARGFTLMEVLVVIAIILVLAAIAVPAVSTFQRRAQKVQAVAQLKQLGTAALTYMNDNNNDLPAEDSKGTDSWASAAEPDNAKAWYNALPKLMGRRPVADYVNTPKDFYTKDNVLFLNGAGYPEGDKKLRSPMYAIAINTKLQRKDADGKKSPAKLSQITNAARTVLFLEQGMPDEADSERKAGVQSKKDFDGAPKGSAKSFVGRWGGKGNLIFLDGGVEEFEPKELLTETGGFPFPPTNNVIWTRTPDEDPNK